MIKRRDLIATAGASAALAATSSTLPQLSQAIEQDVKPAAPPPDGPGTEAAGDGFLGAISLVITLNILAKKKYLDLKKASDPDWIRNNCKIQGDSSDPIDRYLLSPHAVQWDAEIAKLVKESGTLSFAHAKNIFDDFCGRLIANDANDRTGR